MRNWALISSHRALEDEKTKLDKAVFNLEGELKNIKRERDRLSKECESVKV